MFLSSMTTVSFLRVFYGSFGQRPAVENLPLANTSAATGMSIHVHYPLQIEQ